MGTLPIHEIRVTQRHRSDLGDIAVLAESIASRGLLHPPVVTTDKELVVGYRRLKAVESLGWSEVEVRVIDPDDLLLAERDENEIRKDFTASERVAIGRTIEARIGERRGKRTDKQPSNGERVDHGPHVEPGQKTRDVAAEKAGFDSNRSYRQAAKVVDKGVPALVKAMDKGTVSPSAAAAVATLPPEKQKEVVAQGPKAIKAEAKKVRDDKAASRPEPPRKNPLLAALDRIFILLATVDHPEDSTAPGWGGFDKVATCIPEREYQDTYNQLIYLRERLEGWAKRMEELRSCLAR